MAALYHSLFTEKGLELLRDSIQNGTKLGITHMSFGDGGGELPVPDASFTEMVNEVYRVPLNRLAPSKANANWLEADGVIPSAVGGFNIREVGLWAGNVMVAYANYPPTYKPSGDQGTAQIKTIRIVLQIDNTANFELKIDASIVMATIQSVEEAKVEAINYADNTKVHSLESLEQLTLLEPWEGRAVYVKSVKANKGIGGGIFVYESESEKTADGYIVIGTSPKGRWVKISLAHLTVDDFGAVGNNEDDDSSAFNAYALSPYTGSSIFLGVRQAQYAIFKQVNCQGKGLVGGGFSKQTNDAYALNSIRVKDGDYQNQTALLNNTAFIKVGAEVRDLQLKCDATINKNINGIEISAYNGTVHNVNITNFYDQIYTIGATVAFRAQNFTSIGAGNAGFHFLDTNNDQSTTAYFNNCSFQWGKYPILFDKEVYGSSITNTIIEYMAKGFTAKVWSNCNFDQIWAEQTLDNSPQDWLVNTLHQQSFGNTYGTLYIRNPWLNRAATSDIAGSNNTGGISLSGSAVAVNSATGHKVVLSISGLYTRFADWISGPARRLLITTQPTAAGSGYKTPLYINAPNGELYFGNQDETSTLAQVFKRIIGGNADNTAPFFGADAWTKRVRKWQAFDHTVNQNGQFMAPMMLTYDSSFTEQQKNAGWSISKESTGIYVLQRTATTVVPMTNPNIVIGGIVMGSKLGNGSSVNYSIQFIETYQGSFTNYTEAAGCKIFFHDQVGNLVDPFRFSAFFTLVSGF
ncbi:phage tail protein [Acinetobacter baumannii]